ncbi:MAG TPA: hypothetical protein VIN39_07110 [Candidatus Dormibacteraeota bacterium]|jgi:hypothetical protein
MADLPPYPDSKRDPDLGRGRGPTTSTPRWVYVFGVIAIVLVLLFVTLHLTGHSFRGH